MPTRSATITDSRVEQAIRAELEQPAVVVAVPGVRDGQDEIRRGVGHVGVCRDRAAPDLDAPRRIDDVNEEDAVGGVVRVEGDAEEPRLAATADDAAHVDERSRVERAVLVDTHRAGLLDDEPTLGKI